MKKYAVIFTVTNFLLLILLMAIFAFVHIQGNAGMSVGAAIGATVVAAGRFVKDMKREPTSAEKTRFAWLAVGGAWLGSVVLTIVLVAVSFTAGDIAVFLEGVSSGMFLLFFAGAVVFISLIYFFVIRSAFSWYPRLALKHGAK